MTVVNWTGKYLIADRMVNYGDSIDARCKIRKLKTYDKLGGVEFLMGVSGSAFVQPAAEMAGCSMFSEMGALTAISAERGFSAIYVFRTADLRAHCSEKIVVGHLPEGEEFVVVKFDDLINNGNDAPHSRALLPAIFRNFDPVTIGCGGDFYRISKSMGMKPKEILLAMAQGGAPNCGLGWDIIRFGDEVKKHDHVHLKNMEDVLRMKRKFAKKA